jgi:hypothetical protein
MADQCCNDVAMHCHDGLTYKNGRRVEIRFRFRWRRPRAVVVTTADRAPWAVLNRYPGVLIGVAFKLGAHRMLSVLWGRPGEPYEVPVEATDG